MEHITEQEKASAQLILSKTDPERDPVAGETDEALCRQMQETADALRGLMASMDELPQPAFPRFQPGKNRLRLFLPLGAAASVLIGAGIYFLFSADTPQLPEQTQGIPSGELDWLSETIRGSSVPEGTGTMSFKREEILVGGLGGSEGGGPRGDGGGASGKGGAPGSSSQLPSAFSAFIEQFSFRFRIPETLPGGWEFERGRPVSEQRVQLIYSREDGVLSVFLSPSGGPDTESALLKADNRSFTAIRVHGLAVAFEGGKAEPEIWKKTALEFVEKK